MGGAGDFLDCAVDIRYNNGTRSQRGVHIASVYSGIGFGLRRLVAVGAGGKERGRWVICHVGKGMVNLGYETSG